MITSQISLSKRNSSIELLKVIGIVLIIFSHSLPYYGGNSYSNYVDLSNSTKDIWIFMLICTRYLGQIGNTIFIVCSSWFLLNSSKFDIKKILSIIWDSFIISIVILIIFLFLGYNFSTKVIIQQIFPITFQNLWFIGCYLVLYVIHPYLNIVIDHLKKKEHFYLMFIGFIIYSVLSTFVKPIYYYSYLVGFLEIYWIVGYLKKYLKEYSANIKKNIVFCFCQHCA